VIEVLVGDQQQVDIAEPVSARFQPSLERLQARGVVGASVDERKSIGDD
jgi:hypothetical protein